MRIIPAVSLSLLYLSLIVAVLGIGLLTASLPKQNGEISLPGLEAAVTVASDALGNPSIAAKSREDAFRTLGFLHARDRLFQMELMRRKSAGRLAELFGPSAVKLDRKQRSYQMVKTADRIVNDLPADQRQVLDAYVQGVNAYIRQTSIVPPEFLALQHHPEPWQAADSMLVILGMFQTLNGQEYDERMVSVMQQALPADVVTFLTPDTDRYASVLIGGNTSHRFSQSIPVQAWSALPDDMPLSAVDGVDTDNVVAGSNNWVVAGSKTVDGRTIVANDMHLGLGVPNVWYRAELHYPNRHLFGVSLPGAPAIVVGANDHVAWGFTNATADLLDLIRLELKPDQPNWYRTPQGWQAFEQHDETIHVKGAEDIQITLQSTIWGPVSDQPLLSKPVAVKWTALEPHAVDLGLINMDSVQSTQQAMSVLNQTGGPPQNVVIADKQGHIGWTYMGRFPNRLGFDGLMSQSWADGNVAWQGFIAPEQLPRLLDPPEGFMVTANNRTLGSEYPHVLGHNWALGYRAFRIAELLREGQKLSEQDLFMMQMDTRSEVLDFYQQLGLEALSKSADKDEVLQDIENTLKAWDGHMHTTSIGATFLIEFRQHLAVQVFAKVVAAGRRQDADFHYGWRGMETPLRQLLSERPPGVLNTRYRDDWQPMILDTLHKTHQQLQQQFPDTPLTQLSWGKTHPVAVQHPISKALPALSSLLDMPRFDSDGCASICVKVMDLTHGASQRLVVSPAHPENGIFHMPGGQSGHPLSEHYRDQQPFWQNGIAAAFSATDKTNVLYLLPD
ncbi:MAG: penicillin acylase [Methylomonas sp.]|nr:MAG: penicillin acylase [Methylomonas sp.]